MFKSLFLLALSTFSLIAHEISFTKQTLPFGIERRLLWVATDENQAQPVASITILNSTQLRAFDLPAGATIQKDALPAEIITLLDIIASIKTDLSANLEQVVMLGDLYVKPAFRNQGYARLLMQNTCQEIFDTTNTQLIVITVEPFEYENNIQKSLLGTSDFAPKQERLIALYSRCGFNLHQDSPLYMYKARPASNT